MTVTAETAGDFLVELADRLAPHCDPRVIRSVMTTACGGQLTATAPHGRRASTLTRSGIPFEVSVTGGRGRYAPVVRYVTETATQETVFGTRLAAQLAALRELAATLPSADRTAVEELCSFVVALYPEPAEVLQWRGSATWQGIVHHSAATNHVSRLKVYGGFNRVAETMNRLYTRFPEFAGMITVPDDQKLISPSLAALELDGYGQLTHKVYFRTGFGNVATPMKLVRYFGNPAWEMLSEFVKCGLDAGQLHRHRFFVSCTRGGGDLMLSLYLMVRKYEDLSDTVRELAHRHHGGTCAVDAMSDAARSTGASLSYSAVGLGYSSEHGIDKLNVYGVPECAA